jgi:hypothetical protein
MRVVLRCGEIGVSEQFLHGAKIGSAVEQMRSKGVAQCVWMCRGRCTAVEQTTDISSAEASAFAIEKHRIGW